MKGSNESGGTEGSGPSASDFEVAAAAPVRYTGFNAIRHYAISIFILFHLAAIASWALPLSFLPIVKVKQLTGPYMRWSGLFQSWDFFSPNPKSYNSFVTAVVITPNHHQQVWPFPRMDQLSYWQRYRKERYRKFAEVLPQKQNAYLWPDAAKRVAWLFDSPTSPPEAILLIEFSAPITPKAGLASEPVPKPNIFYEDIEYIAPGDLQ